MKYPEVGLIKNLYRIFLDWKDKRLYEKTGTITFRDYRSRSFKLD